MTEEDYKELKKYIMKDLFWLRKGTFIYGFGGVFLTMLVAIGFCISIAYKIYTWDGVQKIEASIQQIEANIEKSNQLIQQMDTILQDVKAAPGKVEGLTDKLFKKKK